jgi:hypothetical protein
LEGEVAGMRRRVAGRLVRTAAVGVGTSGGCVQACNSPRYTPRVGVGVVGVLAEAGAVAELSLRVMEANGALIRTYEQMSRCHLQQRHVVHRPLEATPPHRLSRQENRHVPLWRRSTRRPHPLLPYRRQRCQQSPQPLRCPARPHCYLLHLSSRAGHPLCNQHLPWDIVQHLMPDGRVVRLRHARCHEE